MAVNRTRDRAIAKINYGDSEKVVSTEIRFPGLIDVRTPVIDAVDSNNRYGRRANMRLSVPANYTTGQKCYCPECKKINDVNLIEGTQYGSRESESLYECSGCGYTDRMIVPSRGTVTTGVKKVGGKDCSFISFNIPLRRDAFLSSKDGRFTRFVDSCTYYEYEFIDDGKQKDFSRRVMRTKVDTNGESRNVFQMTADADGEAVAFHHTADSLNPNYHMTRFPSRRDGLGFYGLGEVYHPLTLSEGEEGYFETRPMLVHPSGESSDDSCVSAAYSRISEKFGLPNSSGISNNVKMAVIQLAIIYPGVMERELGIMNENYEFAVQRGTAVSEEAFKKEKMDKIMDVKERIALIDHNIASDLSKLKTGDEVTTYLRSIVFGESPKMKLPKLLIDVRKSKMLDDGYKGKKLKTLYNIDPYGTASNVRQALKLGLRDQNHVNKLLDAAKLDASRANCKGILYPLETRETNRFGRLMIQRHKGNINDVIEDIYYPDADGRDHIGLFEDSASMYSNLMNRGIKIVSTKDEVAMARYMDFLRVVENRIKTPEAIDRFLAGDNKPNWGEHTKDILMQMSSKIEEYKESGFWNVIYRATHDEHSLFDRPLAGEHGLHSELIKLSQDTSHGNEYNYVYQWPNELRERVEKEYDGCSFHLAVDTNELITVSHRHVLDLCIGLDPQYDRKARTGTGALAFMTDKDGNYVAAIEGDPQFKRLYQFKAYKDGMLYGEYVAPAQKWIQDIGAKGCFDTEHFDEYGHRLGADAHGYGGDRALRPQKPIEQSLSLAQANRGSNLADEISKQMLEEKKAKEMQAAADGIVV